MLREKTRNWLDAIVKEQRKFLPGHAACAGCGPAINMHHFLGALSEADPDAKIVLVIPASCWSIIAGIWPKSAFDVVVYLTPFASAAAEAAGIRRGLELRGFQNVKVVVWAGDGATCDIGLATLSASAERNEDLIYVLNDNEAYMNTGVQKSSTTPEGAWTTTTPVASPRTGNKKDIDAILAAHRIPYLATLALGSVPLIQDFRRKVAKAAGIKGFRFLHLLGPCPPGWKFQTSQSVTVMRLAVDSNYFPLFECETGIWRITHRPKKPIDVRKFLITQQRFAHLEEETIDRIQKHIHSRWEELLRLERQSEEL